MAKMGLNNSIKNLSSIYNKALRRIWNVSPMSQSKILYEISSNRGTLLAQCFMNMLRIIPIYLTHTPALHRQQWHDIALKECLSFLLKAHV